jgi:DHA1 family multidrug resistance protein-like MFS transporter
MGHPTWKRTLWVIVFGQGTISAGFSFPFPFMPLFVQELGVPDLGDAAIWAGVLMAAQGIAIGAMGPIWGIVADRFGRKLMVVRSFVGAGVFVALMSWVQDPYQLLVLRFIQGGFSGTIAACSALAVGAAPTARRGYTLGMIQLSVWIGSSIGPVLGGIAAELLGLRWCFFLAGAAMTFAGVAALVLIQESADEKPKPRPAGAPSGRADLQRAMPVILLVLLAEVAHQGINPILPLFAVQVGDGIVSPTVLTGLLFGVAAVMGAAGSVILGRNSDRLGYERVVLLSSAACAVLYVGHALTDSPIVMLILRAAAGFLFGGLIATINALLAARAGAASLGLAYGVADTARSGGRITGPIGAAWLAASAGVGAGFLLIAASLASVAIVTAALMPGAPWRRRST